MIIRISAAIRRPTRDWLTLMYTNSKDLFSHATLWSSPGRIRPSQRINVYAIPAPNECGCIIAKSKPRMYTERSVATNPICIPFFASALEISDSDKPTSFIQRFPSTLGEYHTKPDAIAPIVPSSTAIKFTSLNGIIGKGEEINLHCRSTFLCSQRFRISFCVFDKRSLCIFLRIFSPSPARFFSSFVADQNQDNHHGNCVRNKLQKCIRNRVRLAIDLQKICNDDKNEKQKYYPALPCCRRPAPAVGFCYKPVRGIFLHVARILLLLLDCRSSLHKLKWKTSGINCLHFFCKAAHSALSSLQGSRT